MRVTRGVDGQAGAGFPPELTGPQIARLYRLIVGTDPPQVPFDLALWSQEMIRAVSCREFDMRLSAVVSVGGSLRELGFSSQRSP